MTITRPSAASDWISANPSQTTIPAGRVQCFTCDGSGIYIRGFLDGQPLEDRCPTCYGFGHVHETCCRCEGAGRIEVEYGELLEKVGIDYCDCSAGRHAWETDRTDYLRMSQEAADRGECPF